MKSIAILRNWHWISPYRGSYLYDDIEKKPGVYVIYAYLDKYFRRKKIVYIGKAKNLRYRITGHPIEAILYNNDIKSCCKVRYCESPEILEASLIKKIKPIFNMHHNKEFVTKIYMDYMIKDLHMQNEKNNEI